MLLALVAVSIAAAQIPPASPAPCAVRYVANAGVLFETGGRKFLIDAPIREGISPYAVPTADERRLVEGARPPFDAVTAILVTHWHEDHLNADAVAAHLRASRDAVLVSSAEIADRVRRADPSLPAQRFVTVTPPPGQSQRVVVGGVPLHVLRLRHSARRLPEQHVGFLLEGCRSLLHVGDADSDAANFAALRSLPAVQVGLLPYWYLLDDSGRDLVKAAIRPGRIIGMHLPPSDAPAVSAQLAGLPNLTLLTTPGQRVVLEGK